MMRSHYVEEVKPELDGEAVEVAGWAHELRDLGGVKFVLLRDRTGLIQITLKKAETQPRLLETYSTLVKETAIRCKGVVKKNQEAPGGLELVPSEIEVLGEVLKKVPFEVTGKVPAELDTRLDNRFIDLRRIETSAIFKIRSVAQKAFREKCLALGFQEINPPTIVVSATEGGTELFPVKYFEKEAFLAQSPQLYKQLAVLGGMDKVFMTVPVFRAEKHQTTQHLNEVTQLDVEMGFADDNDALDVLEAVTLHILATVKKDCSRELELLKSEYAVPEEVPRYTYDEVLDALKKDGVEVKWGNDFSKEEENLIPKALGCELFFVTRWPTESRAFYSMPLEDRPEVCKAYDLVFRGLEIASGAQRVHKPDLLIKQLKSRGLKPANFESYIDAFRYGAVPHAGWSIGAERITMQLAGRTNIRECALFPRDRHRVTP